MPTPPHAKNPTTEISEAPLPFRSSNKGEGLLHLCAESVPRDRVAGQVAPRSKKRSPITQNGEEAL